MLLAPFKCLFKWINRIISKSVQAISKIILILESCKFLAYTWIASVVFWSFKLRSKQCEIVFSSIIYIITA